MIPRRAAVWVRWFVSCGSQCVLAWCVVCVFVAGCASQVPIWIRIPPSDNPTLTAVRAGSAGVDRRTVRWGGTVAGVRNRESETELELVERPLSAQGRPNPHSASQGRFLVRVPGFLDPAVYSEGRAVTVRGVLVGEERRRIGDYQYHYPVIVAKHHYLWDPLPPPRVMRDPWAREPWIRDPYLDRFGW